MYMNSNEKPSDVKPDMEKLAEILTTGRWEHGSGNLSRFVEERGQFPEGAEGHEQRLAVRQAALDCYGDRASTVHPRRPGEPLNLMVDTLIVARAREQADPAGWARELERMRSEAAATGKGGSFMTRG
jgi:hypothetical protein